MRESWIDHKICISNSLNPLCTLLIFLRGLYLTQYWNSRTCCARNPRNARIFKIWCKVFSKSGYTSEDHSAESRFNYAILRHSMTTLCFLSERVKCENYLVSYILSDQTRHLYIYLNGLRAIQSLVNLTRMVNLYNPVIWRALWNRVCVFCLYAHMAWIVSFIIGIIRAMDSNS